MFPRSAGDTRTHSSVTFVAVCCETPLGVGERGDPAGPPHPAGPIPSGRSEGEANSSLWGTPPIGKRGGHIELTSLARDSALSAFKYRLDGPLEVRSSLRCHQTSWTRAAVAGWTWYNAPGWTESPYLDMGTRSHGLLYRGTSLKRKRTPLGPYRRPTPRVLGGS